MIKAYTPPLAPERKTPGLRTLVHKDPAKIPDKYTAPTRQAPCTISKGIPSTSCTRMLKLTWKRPEWTRL